MFHSLLNANLPPKQEISVIYARECFLTEAHSQTEKLTHSESSMNFRSRQKLNIQNFNEKPVVNWLLRKPCLEVLQAPVKSIAENSKPKRIQNSKTPLRKQHNPSRTIYRFQSIPPDFTFFVFLKNSNPITEIEIENEKVSKKIRCIF